MCRASAGWCVAVFAIAFLSCGCESKPLPNGLGDYEVVGTSIASGVPVSDASADEVCGLPYPPGVVGTGKYKVTRADDDSIVVLDVNGGCQLQARIENGVITADGADCTLTDDAPLRQLGITSLKYQTFRLDPKSKAHLARWTALQQTSSGVVRSCNVLEGHIIKGGQASSLGPGLLRYDTDFTRDGDQPGSAATCGKPQFEGRAGGFVSIDAATSSVRFEGWGCAVKAQKDAQGALVIAAPTPCQRSGPLGYSDVGITGVTFDAFKLDVNAKTFKASGNIMRAGHDGPTSTCIELDGKVEQAAQL